MNRSRSAWEASAHDIAAPRHGIRWGRLAVMVAWLALAQVVGLVVCMVWPWIVRLIVVLFGQ